MDVLKRFREETEPDEVALARVRRRVIHPWGSAPPLERGWGRAAWISGGIGGALALAAAAWIGLSGPGDAPIPAASLGEGERALMLSGGRVRLAWEGTGEVAGRDLAPRIAWESGEIAVEVEPGQGIGLEVHTREAQVRVVGTGFTVRRDAYGTAVSVRHGRVEVVCAGGGTEPPSKTVLSEGEERLCLPVGAAGLLARARAQQGAGAGAAEWLQSVEAGLAAPERSAAVEGELRVMQIQGLDALGRREEARAAAVGYVAQPQAARAREVRRYLATLALEAGDCGAAIPHLEALVAPPDPAVAGWAPGCADLVWLSDCSQRAGRVENVRRPLEAAREVCHTPAEREGVERRLSALKGGTP